MSKKIHFEVNYEYPDEMNDEDILDRFAAQIIHDASTINSKDIQKVDC